MRPHASITCHLLLMLKTEMQEVYQ